MTRPLYALAALAFLVAGIVLGLSRLDRCVQDSALARDELPARYWRDDPSSNDFGPLTGVVWVEDLEGGLYHRGLCPERGEASPFARRALTQAFEPCPLCNPEKETDR